MGRISALATTVRKANNTDVKDMDDPTLGTSGSRQISVFDEHGQFHNALATRGGVAFDGTSSTRIYSTLTGQAIATDPFAISVFIDIPFAAIASDQGICAISSSSTTPSTQGAAFYSEIKVDGSIHVYLTGATGGDTNTATIANVVTNYAGKRIHLMLIRPTSGNVLVYINAVQVTPTFSTTGTPVGWQGSVTSTFFNLGYNASTQVRIGCIYGATLYNLALSASDVIEIFELNGGVPDRFKFGSETGYLTGDDSTFTSSIGSWGTASGPLGTASGGVLNFTNAAPSHTIAFASNRRYRLTYTSTGGSLTPVTISGTGVNMGSQAAGTHAIEFTTGPGNTGFYLDGTSAGACTLDNVTMLQIGAVCHLPLNDSIGYQLRDESTNKLHAIMSTTGVSHVQSGLIRCGEVRFSTSTNGNQQLYGQACIPAGAIITSITADTAGTPTVTLGSTSGTFDLVDTVTLVAGKNTLQTPLDFTPGTSLWANSTTTDSIAWTIEYEIVD